MEEKMTEKQFLEKFKKKGFELYKTKDLRPKLKAYYKIQEMFNQQPKKK